MEEFIHVYVLISHLRNLSTEREAATLRHFVTVYVLIEDCSSRRLSIDNLVVVGSVPGCHL